MATHLVFLPGKLGTTEHTHTHTHTDKDEGNREN